jgi:hypothetical protein
VFGGTSAGSYKSARAAVTAITTRLFFQKPLIWWGKIVVFRPAGLLFWRCVDPSAARRRHLAGMEIAG